MSGEVATKTCRKCPAGTEPEYLWREYTNGDMHVIAHCGGCGDYLRYVPQTPAVLAKAGPRPRPGEATAAPLTRRAKRKTAEAEVAARPSLFG